MITVKLKNPITGNQIAWATVTCGDNNWSETCEIDLETRYLNWLISFVHEEHAIEFILRWPEELK